MTTEFSKEWLDNNGTTVRAGGNAPILLNGSSSAWLVRSGKVDIFSVGLQDGVPSGKRDHLARMEVGAIIFGSGDSIDCGDRGLLAVGTPDTELIRLPLSSLREAAAHPEYGPVIIRKIEGWVSNLSAGIARRVPPKFFQRIEPEKELVLAELRSVRPSASVVWVRHLEGTSRFLGLNGLALMPEDDRGFFPLSSKAWLETDGEVRMEALSSSRWLESDLVWKGLDFFFRFVLEAARLGEENSLEQTVERIKLRAKEESQAEEGAAFRLASLLSDGKDGKAGKGWGVSSAIVRDPLTAACKLVAEASGVRVTSLPPSGESKIIDKNKLEEIASSLRMRFRQVMLNGEWWQQELGPLLGSIEESGQPVAILPSSGGGYTIVDPVEGKSTTVAAETVGVLSPFGYSFYRSFPDRPLELSDIIKLGTSGSRKDIIRTVLMGILGGCIGVMTPMLMGHVFDAVIPEGSRFQLLQVALTLVVVALTMAAFQIVRSIALIRIEGRMNTSIQAAVVDRLLNMPVPFFREYTAGDLALRVGGINAIRQLISGAVVLAVMNGIFSLFNLGLLFFYQIKLALIASALACAGLGFGAASALMSVRHTRESLRLDGKLSGMVLQFISGISKLRVAGAEVFAFSAWADQFAEKKQADLRTGSFLNREMVFNSVFPVVCSMLIFLSTSIFMKDDVTAGKTPLSTGDFLAFNAAFTAFLTAMAQMTLSFFSALSAVPLYERALPILQGTPELDAKKADPGELQGDVEIGHVIFRYIKDGPPVLDDLSIKMKPGEFVAIVGPSGSGKSTLLRLLLGFERPEKGAVYYDGKDLGEMDVQAVRRQIGVVLQSSRISTGSIFVNIVGSLNLTINDAWEAARMAGFDKDIEQMPMQMHTVISEGGGTLSGGQRQRLLIARALIKKPRIIFFDEATSALDNQTQSIVSQSLQGLNATKVVIAHRLSTIMNADRIIVLQSGKVAEEGNYRELMEKDGLFAALAKRQLV